MYKILLFLLPVFAFAVPQDVTSVWFTDVSKTSVTIHWDYDDVEATGYKIYRDGNYLATLKNYDKNYIDKGLQSGKTYTYLVKTTNDSLDLKSPFGLTNAYSPTFTWQYREGVSYSILIKARAEDGVNVDWSRPSIEDKALTPNEINCDASTALCSYTLDANKAIKGNYIWWINASDIGWSERGYFSVNGYQDLDDGRSGISKGYGVWGNYKVAKTSVIEPMEDNQNIKVTVTTYKPTTGATKKPTIFFIAGYGRNADSYDKLLNFLASHGYYVVHLYHNEALSLERSYADYLKIVEKVVTEHSDEIDTTKMGVIGHSLGGGTAIWLGKKLFGNQAGDKNWGQSGSFVFALSPWYPLYLTKDDLDHYPTNTKLLIQLSEDEIVYEKQADGTKVATDKRTTDPRVLRTLFENIAIADDDKDLIVVNSDNQSYNFNGKTYTYQADHYLSYTKTKDISMYGPGEYQPYDMLDVLLINRLSHAMLNYVFQNDTKAKDVALGHGSVKQVTMRNQEITLTPLTVPKPYTIQRPQNKYVFPCSDGGWTTYWYMKDYCGN